MYSVLARGVRVGSRTSVLTLVLSALGTTGCSTLPASGPTTRSILRAERDQVDLMAVSIVDIDARLVSGLASSAVPRELALASLDVPGEVDIIGPGDVLQITIFEVGAALFGSGAGALVPGGAPS